jgi:hypothetical protein
MKTRAFALRPMAKYQQERLRGTFAVSATILLACVALLATACASQEKEEASEPQSNQNTAEGTSEDTDTREKTRSSTTSEKVLNRRKTTPSMSLSPTLLGL